MGLSLLISLVLAAPEAAVAQPRAAVPAVQPIGNAAPARVLILAAFASPLTAPALSPGSALLHPALDERMAVFLQHTAAAAPAQIQTVQAVPKAAGAVQVLAAANRELASFSPEQLEAMAPEELNNLAGRIMDEAGAPRPAVEAAVPAPTADLPPTSLKRALSKKDIQHLLSYSDDFKNAGQTTFESILMPPSSILEVNDFRTVLYNMYQILSRAVDGPGSNEERVSLAIAIQDRYIGFLSDTRAAHTLIKWRVAAGRTLHRLLKSGALIEELFHRREVDSKIKKLDVLLAAAPQSADEAAHSQDWKIPSRLPNDQRILTDSRKNIVIDDINRYSSEIDEISFKIEQALTRSDLVEKDPRFSEAFRDSQRQHLATVAKEARRLRDIIAGDLAKYIAHRLYAEFVFPKKANTEYTTSEEFVHPGLELTSSGNDLILKARFATTIADPKVHAFVKSSIEDYWNARFVNGEQQQLFRTEVSVRALKAGEDFSPDELRLFEDPNGSHATLDTISLSRTDIEWFAPAHEFGHVLGLPDEYISEYDVRHRLIRHSQPQNSLMGGHYGTLLSHHLESAINRLTEGGRHFTGTGSVKVSADVTIKPGTLQILKP